MMFVPKLSCNDKTIQQAFEIAIRDLCGNIKPFGIHGDCLMAGYDYDTPWTRDAAINVYNGFDLISPEVAKNTLQSVLTERDGQQTIGGQYWDCIIWSIGFKAYCERHPDPDFLQAGYDALKNTVLLLEQAEFDPETKLFYGPAVYGDGIAAYPDEWINSEWDPSIWQIGNRKGDEILRGGYGLHMRALSTNCLYAHTYRILADLAEKLHQEAKDWTDKADCLTRQIQKLFQNPKTGSYDYLYRNCDFQEGLGISFLLQFGLLDGEEAKRLISHTVLSPHGIACLDRTFPRYETTGEYGRHSGTIWPFINGFWANAVRKYGFDQLFEQELYSLAEKIVRDGQCYEIYHPISGMPYGGIQEDLNPHPRMWESCRHQSWSASAFLSMILYGILGMTCSNGTLAFYPKLPERMEYLTIENILIDNHLCRLSIDSKNHMEKS